MFIEPIHILFCPHFTQSNVNLELRNKGCLIGDGVQCFYIEGMEDISVGQPRRAAHNLLLQTECKIGQRLRTVFYQFMRLQNKYLCIQNIYFHIYMYAFGYACTYIFANQIFLLMRSNNRVWYKFISVMLLRVIIKPS